MLRDTASVKLREKLFGYKTVNFLNPFKLYRQFGEWYPLALQDYRLSFNMSQDFSQLILHNQSRDLHQTNAAISIKEIKGGDTTIYVRSRDSEHQEDKELEKVLYVYPEMKRFTKVTPHNEPIIVKCVCGTPIPDYFFLYIERIDDAIYQRFENESPKVVGLSIKRNGQQIRIYNETQLSKFDLLDMTRRNSHPRADMRQLYEEFGGVLINRYDLGTLLDEQVTTYELNLEFTIVLELEPNSETVSKTESNLLAAVDDAVGNLNLSAAETASQQAANARYDLRIQQDTRATVLFLYDGGSRLEGTSVKMEFVQTIY